MIQKLKKLNNYNISKALKLSIVLNVIMFSIITGHFISKTHVYKKKFNNHSLVSKSIMKEHREDIRSKNNELITALLAEPYDKKEVAEAFIKLNKSTDKARTLINNAIVEEAAKLESKQRLKLLPRHLKRALKNKHPHRDNK